MARFGSWYFRLDRENGRWRRLSAAWMWRFLHGEDQVPDPAGSEIFVAEVLVELEERIPMRLLSLTFTKDPINRDGSLDRERFDENLRLVLESVPLPVRIERGSTVVESAHSRFAQRRRSHQVNWQPTAAELQGLQGELARHRLLTTLVQ